MKNRNLFLLAALTIMSQVLYSATFTISPGSSIQTAINSCINGDTIVLGAGTYSEKLNIKGKSITITSADPSNPAQTVIDGQNNIDYVVNIYQDKNDPDEMSVSLTGITISRAGRVAVYCYGLDSKLPKLSIDRCIISNNINTTGFYGGLLLSKTGRVDIISSVIRDNQNNGIGAGLYASEAGMVNVVNSVFTGNKAQGSTGAGGAIYLFKSEAIFYNTAIYGNSSGNIGGGVLVNNAATPDKKPKFYNCLINGNKANKGGGIYLDDISAVEIYNSVLCGNDNHGIYGRVSSASVIKNCILWDNDQSQIYSPPKNAGESEAIDARYCIIKDGYSYGKHIVTTDPEFELAGNWVSSVWNEPYVSNPTVAWHLGDLSPGIDGGDPNYCPPSADSLDIDGEARYISSCVDIGFDEYISPTTGESGLVYNVGDDYWHWSLGDALVYAGPGDELIVSPGRYNESLIITDELDGLSISGRQPHDDIFRSNTIIDASGLNSPAVIFGPNISVATKISGLKIINGEGYYYSPRAETVGGGIFCDQSSPTVSFCRVEDNSAYSGGGVAIVGGSPVFAGCVFKNNSCTNLGPGVLAISGSEPTFKNCVFNQNKTDSEDDSNTGALHFDASSSAADGLMRNCLFRDNMPYGLYKAGTGLLELNSSIIWNNNKGSGAIDANQLFSPNMSSFELNYCDIEGGWNGTGNDNIAKDPGFKVISYLNDSGESVSSTHDYILGQNSSDLICINLGDSNYLPAEDELDINGQKRKGHCRVDIGPWEFTALTGILQRIPALALAGTDYFCSVQEAYNFLVKNNLQTSLQVTKGVYHENVIVSNSAIRIAGSVLFEPEEIIIDGSYKNIASQSGPFDIDDPNDPNFMGAAITLAYGKANNTTISGMTLIGNIGSLDADGKFKGGAINSRHNNNIFIDQCIIRNSAAYDGGGVYIDDADLVTIHRTEFKENTATNFGGALCLTNCDSVITSSSLFARNNAVEGGGIYNIRSKLDLDFCTIADNLASLSGDGVRSVDAIADTTISSSIITGSGSGPLSMSGTDAEMNFTVDYSCVSGGFAGDNNFDLDPKFIDPANLDYRISVYSPCFNAANPEAAAAPYELAELGNRSIMGSNHSNYNYDIGAYEMVNMLADYHKTRPVQNITSGQYYYTIQDAVQDSSPYDTIVLQPGLYNEIITINTDGLTIKSALSPAHLAMHRTIIQAGVVDTEDGDINSHSSPAITLTEMLANNVTIEGVTIMDGAGQERTFNYYANEADNKMKVGGGIFSVNNDGLTLRWVNIAHNTADCGGGLALLSCSNVTLDHCIISNNTANRRRGGAIWLADGCYNLTITNSTIAHNTANDTKSAVDSITTQCGGVLLENAYSGVVIKNSVFWGNNLYNMHPMNNVNITASYSVLPGNSGSHILASDPLFVNVGKYDYHLKSTVGRWQTWQRKWLPDTTNSPAIDAGDGTTEQKTAELYPAGDNINLGVYGGSPQASLSHLEAQSVVEKANFNRDSEVNISDLAILAATWYSGDCFNPGDIDRDCSVDLADLEAFVEGWLQ